MAAVAGDAALSTTRRERGRRHRQARRGRPRASARSPAIRRCRCRPRAGWRSWRLAGFGALHWMVLLEPAAPRRALYALGAAAVAVLGLLAVARLPELPRLGRPRRPASRSCAARARAARRRRRRRAAAARPLGRARLRHRPRPRGAARRARALPRPRRVDPHRDPGSAARVLVGRRAARVLAARGDRIGFPAAALIAARRRSTRCPPCRSTSRTSSCAARRSRCSCSPSCGSRSCRSATRGNAGLVAAAVAILALMLAPALDTRRAVVGLRDAGRSEPPPRAATSSAGTTTTARSTGRATAASCCACSARSARRTGRPRTSTVFDGRRWIQDDAAAHEADPGVPENAEAIAGRHAGDQGHDPQPLQPTLRHRRLHATSSSRRRSARRRAATAPGRPGRTLRRGDAYTALVYTPSTEREPAPRGRQRDRPRGPAAASAR